MCYRSEQEMMGMLMGFAEGDGRVRAAWLNGSRANPNAPKDRWQDFDIVFAVDDYESFLADPHWVDRFGERAVMQTRAEQEPAGADFSDWFIYLMQFTDGNRIDLTLVPLDKAEEAFLEDRMRVLLLDKDKRLPAVPPATDEDYWVKKPGAKEFADCCNEFLWVVPYVAKGLWRGEFTYAQGVYHGAVRDAFDQMAGWRIGLDHNFSVNPGKKGKWYQRFLPAEEWDELYSTYDCGSEKALFDSLLRMMALFQKWGHMLSKALGYPYPDGDQSKVMTYIQMFQLRQPAQ